MPSAFQLRTKPEIQAQQFATMTAQLGTIVDENIGAIVRAFVEASSLSDAAQYVQMSKLIALFNRFKCKGSDLDRRALEFGAAFFAAMKRQQASASTAQLLIGDGSLYATSTLVADVTATSTSFQIADATGWPVSGEAVLEEGTLREESIVFTLSGTTISVVSPASGLVNPHLLGGTISTVSVKSVLAAPVGVSATTATIQSGTETAWPASGSVIFERETVRRELVTFTRVGTTLTLGTPTTFAHNTGSDVILSTFGSDRTIASGSAALAPATLTTQAILYRTTQAGTLFDGDFTAALVPATTDDVGADTMVGSGAITEWQSPPFANATVTNPLASGGGRDQEQDDAYNARLSTFIQSLSRGTALAIETLLNGETDPFSESTIEFAQTVEPVAPGAAQVYVTDGTPDFQIDYQVFSGRDVLISDARPNDARAVLHQYGPFQTVSTPTANITPRLFKSSVRGVGTNVSANTFEDSTQAWTTNQFAGFYLKTDDDQFYPIVSNSAIALTLNAGGVTPSLGSYSIFNLSANPLVPGVDYTFNQSNGNIELATPLVQHDGLVAASDGAAPSIGAYTYSRGLAAYAQRLVNGDRSDWSDFPGIKSLGTTCLVVAPTVVSPTIVIQVVTATGFTDAALQTTVQTVIESYVNSLGIGQPILISQIIALVKPIVGVADCKVISPTSNVTIAAGQIARISASNVVVV